ncbi:RodZ domain-containing protein [Marinobacter halophilus]|uniref:DUF4115 domain-containing protein n=1 Tax=Marinobacter halophilus TaxID=1323740 RepID=A0A2T1KGZ9_9GAMM|nr:RodZ domain-containing protein [Marinobacter halophilus]PSF09404.1 DUF4115 domain-containing protein [Marinobacter halophilus]GGC78196.1 transcriptional regulator [Marinobacter halophilus]
MSGEVKPDQVAAERVGEQLRLGRERLGLDLSAIADEQHLRPSVIQAIESGDYSKIDSELFLKGYVRAYARQVGLDADAVIAELDRELEPGRQQKELEYQANPLVSIELKKRRKRQLAKLLVVLVILAAAAYLIAAYLAERDVGVDPATEGSSQMAAPQENLMSSADSEQGAETPEALVQEPEPVPFDEAAEPLNETAESLNVPADPMPAEAVPEDLPPDQVPVVTQLTEPALQEPEVLPVSDVTQARLQMSFSDDCWIQVTDAEGNRLASSLRRSGDQLDVAGEAPFRVVIGAVSAVESIRFQGETLNVGDLRVVNNRSEFSLEL